MAMPAVAAWRSHLPLLAAAPLVLLLLLSRPWPAECPCGGAVTFRRIAFM